MINRKTMKDNKPKTTTIPDFLWEMLHEIAIEENHGSRSASLRNILEKVYKERQKQKNPKAKQED